MAWTTPRTFVAGEVETASIFNTHLRDNLLALNGFVRKTADESVTSSAVLQNDDELALAIPAAGTYVFDLRLFAASAANTAGDLRVGFSFPAGTLDFALVGLDISLASSFTGSIHRQGVTGATSGTTAMAIGLSTNTTVAEVYGVLVATAAGALQMMWAQSASNANASTIKAGSYMTMKQVA